MLASILKTNTAYRTITIPKILIDFLQDLKEINSSLENDFVVLNHDGAMCNPRNLSMNFTHDIKKYSEKENKKILPYMQLKQISFRGLRHTHATILLIKGENIKIISERLGHTSTQITWDTYSHVLPEMKKGTTDLLDNMFNELYVFYFFLNKCRFFKQLKRLNPYD